MMITSILVVRTQTYPEESENLNPTGMVMNPKRGEAAL